ncbi:MAG: hypothetical protein FGM27_01780 [Candidatus Omnitrophica bacterium]|nr:hypothetical protein [Candidatus Omnitrophota bacterium]
MIRFFKALAGAVVLILIAAVFLLVNFRTEKFQQMDGQKEELYFFNKKIGERHYRNGVLEGKTRAFHSDGKLKAEFMFKEGLREGTAKHYTPKGNLRFEDFYVRGDKKWRKKYDDSGKLISEKKYK